MASAKAITDHDEIRRWVEERGGHPARVKRTGRGSYPGGLRIDYPGYSGEDTLEAIEWDEFFEWFDRDKLAFLASEGDESRFSKFVRRGRSAASKRAPAKRTSSSSKKASSSKKKPASSKKASSSKTASSKRASSSKKTS